MSRRDQKRRALDRMRGGTAGSVAPVETGDPSIDDETEPPEPDEPPPAAVASVCVSTEDDGREEDWMPLHPLTPDARPTPEAVRAAAGMLEPVGDASQGEPDAPILTETEEQRRDRKILEQREKANAAWFAREAEAMRADVRKQLEEEGYPPQAMSDEIDRRIEEAKRVAPPPQLPPDLQAQAAQAGATELAADDAEGFLLRAVALLKQLLARGATRMANGRPTTAMCQLCEQSSPHGPGTRCNCPCHQARRFIATVERSMEESALAPAAPPVVAPNGGLPTSLVDG